MKNIKSVIKAKVCVFISIGVVPFLGFSTGSDTEANLSVEPINELNLGDYCIEEKDINENQVNLAKKWFFVIVRDPIHEIKGETYREQKFDENFFNHGRLEDVVFEDCDLSNQPFKGTVFKNVRFIGTAKLSDIFKFIGRYNKNKIVLAKGEEYLNLNAIKEILVYGCLGAVSSGLLTQLTADQEYLANFITPNLISGFIMGQDLISARYNNTSKLRKATNALMGGMIGAMGGTLCTYMYYQDPTTFTTSSIIYGGYIMYKSCSKNPSLDKGILNIIYAPLGGAFAMVILKDTKSIIKNYTQKTE